MKLSDLCVHVSLLRQKQKVGKHWGDYKLRVNKFLRSVIKKLYREGVLDQLLFHKNTCTFRASNILSLKKLDRTYFNKNNRQKVVNQHLQNDSYCEILVSTSQGIHTLRECFLSNIGGVLLAKYVKENA